MKKINFWTCLNCVIVIILMSSCDYSDKVDKALANRDFEKARKYAYKCSTAGDQSSVNQTDYRKQNLYKVNKAQINYIIDTENDWEAADQLSREVGGEDAFHDVFVHHIKRLVNDGKMDIVINVISNWITVPPYKESFVEVMSNNLDLPQYTNDDYNKDVDILNQSINIVLAEAIVNKDKVLIKRCVNWFQPKAVMKEKKGFFKYDISYELKDEARERAIAKIKEAGITIK